MAADKNQQISSAYQYDAIREFLNKPSNSSERENKITKRVYQCVSIAVYD